MLRVLGLHLAGMQVLASLMNLMGKLDPSVAARDVVGIDLSQRRFESREQLRMPGQAAEPSTRGLPLFRGGTQKQGRKQYPGAARAEMFGFSFANEK